MVTRGHLDKIKDETNFYQHQADGVRLMARMGSFLLADEMGLGKSLQALTVAAIDYELGFAKRTLIVCPATLKGNWLEEVEEHTKFSALVLEGTPTQRNKQLMQFASGMWDILIVNYEQVRPHKDEINALDFDISVWDEAHYLKNHSSKRTKAALGVHTRRRFFLTGSPMLNRADELWTILHMIDPTTYPDYWRFRNRYCVLGGFRGKQVVGIKNKAELMLGVNQIMIRRLKKDVLDLPEKQYIQIKVDLYNEQKKLYREAFEDLKITLPGDPNPMELENALTKFLRLKEICGSTWKFTGEDHSAKLDRAEEICLEVIGNLEHFVVFSQFIHIQDLLRERLTKLGVPCYVMNGQTTKPGDRVPLINTWATGPPSVLIAGLQVGGVGLNLTQANKCLFIDKLFVPKLNEQAEDRLHRIGADQTKPVQIYSLICRGTIEMRVENILKRKTKLFDTLIENQGWKSAIYKAILESDDV